MLDDGRLKFLDGFLLGREVAGFNKNEWTRFHEIGAESA
jgi:hypothetical protein